MLSPCLVKHFTEESMSRSPSRESSVQEGSGVWENTKIKLDNSALMRTPAFMASLYCLTQSKDILLQTQLRKEKWQRKQVSSL